MNNERFHPVQSEPPLAHALHHWDRPRGLLTYEYNGFTVLEVRVAPGTDLGFRHGSDGSMLSVAYLQQLYFASDTPCEAVFTFRVHADCLNLRPRRAGREEAVLGTQSGLLHQGVAGLYDGEWDLLFDWYGRSWSWTGAAAAPDERFPGFVTASFTTRLGRSALYMNLRPRYYANTLGFRFHRPWVSKPRRDAVAGWCSWEAYRRDISLEKIKAAADFLRDTLAPYGLRYLQVDDGFQAMPLPARAEGTMAEGWTTCDGEKFPQGHPSIVKAISDRGLLPGVWVNANITNPDFPRHHPGAVIWHGGEAMKGEWIDYLYTCDPATLKEQVTPIFAAMRDQGYKYVKIDAIRHLLFDGLHECVRLGMMTSEEATARFRAFMEASARGLGEDIYYLASWGVMQEVVGVADACRIAMDANPTWAGVRMQLFESARWYHTQRILFTNDPDHVCVRTKAGWARSILSLISLSGQLCMLSDAPEAYTPEKLDIIRRTLPVLTTRAGETGPMPVDYAAYTWTKLHGFAVQSHETPVEMEDVDLEEAMDIAGWAPDREDLHPFSSLWSFALRHHGRDWRVMLRVAATPLRAGSLPLDRIALDPARTYVAFDFWAGRYLGEVTGSFACPALELGCCQAVAFYEKPGLPTVIASDRHVSMDAVSILVHQQEKHGLHLTLSGVAGESFTYYVYLPEGYAAGGVRCEGAAVSLEAGEVLALKVTFESETAQVWLETPKA